MRRVKIIVSGGSLKQNKKACASCTRYFSAGTIANPTDPVRGQNGEYYFYMDVMDLNDDQISQTILDHCTAGHLVTINVSKS